ncbi:MAG: hypothetical protein HN919_15800 [Verrucomicrobia bacterium]|jgi:hypothetical protein|nr:hypothetical protein [Verrucomicrobiota bacterium]MBT7067763.1 hypothetical protein [Verrucomicrobiota bacterium]MBT7699202.1 hypothetical protein [Verrucomicrobiota bacterium]
MTRHTRTLTRVVGLLLFTGSLCTAEPHIGYVYPAGGQQGSTVELLVGGQFLEDASGVVYTGKGLRGSIVGYFKELTRQEINRLRNRREKLEQTVQKEEGEKRATTEAELAEILAEFTRQGYDESGKKRLKGVKRDPRKQPNAQLREQVTLRCRIDATAAPGLRELRLQTPKGLSNAIMFHVGRVPEIRESEPNDREPVEDQHLALPAVVNGQVLPGDIDRFRIAATQGQRLVCKVAARSLVPYLADAVPGWFQAALTLYDADGKELLFVDDDHFDPDPLLVYDIPADGDYILEIRDAIYRGREDFTYRLTMADGVTLTGPLPTAAHGPVRQKGDVAEREPNDTPEQAQSVVLPVMLHGTIAQPGEWDVFAFDGRPGQSIVVETIARRADSPLDSVVQLRGPGGNVLEVNDDHVDRGQGLVTHHADSYFLRKLPFEGRYTVHVGDIQGKGSERHAYRLRISPVQPDFELRVTPATLSIPPGGTVPLTVHLLRRDGFAGGVSLALDNNPGRFRLDGGFIPPGSDKVQATLTVPWKSEAGNRSLALLGRATIGGETLTRQAVAAEDRMQAFLWRHLVPVEDWIVSVGGKSRMFLKADRPPKGPLLLPAGTNTVVVLRNGNPKKPIRARPRFELQDPPEGMTLSKSVFRAKNKEAALHIAIDPDKLAPGSRGNLIITILANNKKTRKTLGTLPAVPYKVTIR